MAGLAPSRKATILVVDDTPDNLALMNRLLQQDYQVKIATDGENALRIAAADPPPELILLDIAMPGLDGYEVCRRLKNAPSSRNIPVIFLTGMSEVADEEKGLALGAVDYITKPISPPIVLARVRSQLAQKAMADVLQQQNIALEQKVLEVETSHGLIRRQSDEVKRLYEEVLAEQKRSIELSLQPGTMVGLEKEERLGTRLFRSLQLRHHWLQINLLTAFVAGAEVAFFQGTLDRLLILTIFLPVLAGQAGNTGSQALAITLRGMTLGDLLPGKGKLLIRKEALLGLMNGALVGLVAALGMYAVASFHDSPRALMLSAVVFLAMTGSCIISGVCGAVVPLVLKRMGADPVTASSIFLSTATDVVSIGLLLGLAAMMVR